MAVAITFDHSQYLINITSPQDTLTCQDLINAIREEEASASGIRYPQIAKASGKEELGAGVDVGITVELVSPWQVKFWAGNYIAKIAGGNLVGGLGGDPVAYSAGVQVLLVMSAASTTVTVSTGSGLSTEEHDKLMALPSAVSIAAAVWDFVVETTYSASNLLRLFAAVLTGKVSGAGTGTETFKGLDDSTDRVISTVDDDGNRTQVTRNVS